MSGRARALDLELAVVASRMVDGEPIRAFLDGFAVEGRTRSQSGR